jgi:phosphoglucosamine mutase
MARELFGTDGVRGRANVDPMTAEMALALGQAVSVVFKRRGGERHRIIIGKDTRLSGYMFENALVAGICSMGVDVLQVGPIPTPGMAFLTVDMRCDAGVMISASHNPYQDNGIKFFSHDGYKLPDEFEARIEELIASGALAKHRAAAEEVGRAQRIEDATGRYVVFLKKTFPQQLTLEGLRVVLDCANGASYKVGPTVLTELDAEVFSLGIAPNGRNINDGVGSVHPETVQAKVKELRADVGICLDGDADRCQMVDEKGNLVDGDAILALAARDMVERGVLRGGAVVATVMSNLGLERAVERLGLRLVRTAVGDRYVVEEMRRNGYNFGGEQSGHLIFLDHVTTGDGVAAALNVLAVMQREGRPLSELARCFEPVPQALVNVAVREKRPLAELPAVGRLVAEVERALGSEGRVLVRFSGTENKVRILVEGTDAKKIRAHAEAIAEELRKAIG